MRLVWALALVMASCALAERSQAQADPADRLWSRVEPPAERRGPFGFLRFGAGPERPAAYVAFRLDRDALAEILARVPDQSTFAARELAPPEPLELSLPLPDGTLERFALEVAPVLSPELAIKYPQIRTYRGAGSDGAALRLEVTPSGLHAEISRQGEITSVGPLDRSPRYFAESDGYAAYRKPDGPTSEDRVVCLTPGEPESAARPGPLPAPTAWGRELRTYRLAVAATGEYVEAVGGTVEASIDAIARTINRVNGIYESELAIRLELVANNDRLIFTEAGDDPFDNDDANSLIDQSQATIDRIIGDAGYDIGHTFSTGAGGLAGLGVVGQSGRKASGVTGAPNPTGDAYDVDYVAHEMGHQFGANHTFNGTLGSCSGNRNSRTAYEPGSGSTIQGYAGICEADDLQPHSDPYFHAASLQEIAAYVSHAGDTPRRVPTENALPSVTAKPLVVVPASTAFELTADGADADAADRLTYVWEELDLGRASTLATGDDGDIPLFRSRGPQTSGARSFPRVASLLGGGSDAQEKVPALPRESLFRVTVRDHYGHGVGAFAAADTRVRVAANTGPFRITAPAAGETIGGLVLIRWDVAGTSAPPLSAARVAIGVSRDGGASFAELVRQTPNDGSELVALPSGGGPVVFKVAALDAAFFAVSPEFARRDGGPSIVLVRHAEKGSGGDPDLTTEGATRAQALATLLASAHITGVHATESKRSRQTAEPTAEIAGVPVDVYDGEAGLLDVLRHASPGEHHLVVAHSNTVPAIARELGVAWSDPDPLEAFDRAFVIEIGNGPPSFRRLRFTASGEGGFYDVP